MRAHTARVGFDGNTVSIKPKVALRLIGLPKETVIPIEAITACEWRGATWFLNGWLKFLVHSDAPPTGVWKSALDEYTVAFRVGAQARRMEQLRIAVETHLDHAGTTTRVK